MSVIKNNSYSFLNNLKRTRTSISRINKIRLDKNEKSDEHSKIFFNSVIKKIKHFHLTAYPETEKIYNLLSKKLRIEKKSILITYGSDGGIKTCFDFLTKKSDKIIYFEPTFAMVSIYTQVKQLTPRIFKYDKNFCINLEKVKKKIIKENIKLLIFANPNSPTGNCFKKSEILEILKICREQNTYVIIDEAYYGFSKTSFINYINKFKNLIVLRTFSKSYGLAGLRAGYLAANKYLCQNIFKIKPMYEMTSITSVFVEEILKNKNIEKNYIDNIISNKNNFINFLKKSKIKYIDTQANFIHVEINKNKNNFVKLLKKNKILINDKKIINGLEKFIRISIGSTNQMKKLYILFKKHFKK